MEARLYAENPATGFLPSTGPLAHLRLPSDIRVDSGVAEGTVVTPFYDPMIAKLIVHAPGRAAAAAALARACGSVEVWPVKTNAAFLQRAAADPDFVAGRINTGFIERHADRLVPGVDPGPAIVQAAARALLDDRPDDPWTALVGFRANASPDCRVAVEIAGVAHLVEIGEAAGSARVVTVAGERILFHDGEAWPFGPPVADNAGKESGASDGVLVAPMPGRVIAVDVAPGQGVARGQRLLVLEAMKMEQALLAPFDGSVDALNAAIGAQVAEGAVLVRIVREGE